MIANTIPPGSIGQRAPEIPLDPDVLRVLGTREIESRRSSPSDSEAATSERVHVELLSTWSVLTEAPRRAEPSFETVCGERGVTAMKLTD